MANCFLSLLQEGLGILSGQLIRAICLFDDQLSFSSLERFLEVRKIHFLLATTNGQKNKR